MRTLPVTAVIAGALTLLSADALAETRPAMSANEPVLCQTDGKNEQWRIQCDEVTKRCLYAPDSEVDEQHQRTRPLQRAPHCGQSGVLDIEALQRKGFTMVPAIVPAPEGWMRDERGRVFQFNFDLHKRVYVGGGWAPQSKNGKLENHGYVDFALLQMEGWEQHGNSIRHRLRLVEGEIRLAPFWGEGVLLRYDLSQKRKDPLLRVTTFFGTPRRGDLRLDSGLFFEVARVEILPRPVLGQTTVLKYGTAHVTFDLWQSGDLYSYVRLRGGASLERWFLDESADRMAVTPAAAIDADLTLDRDGFHHVTANAIADSPRFYDADRGFRGHAIRLKGELGYEVIVLALNDQPVTLRFSGQASRRDDVPGWPSGLLFAGNAGLRFNLWAPAR